MRKCIAAFVAAAAVIGFSAHTSVASASVGKGVNMDCVEDPGVYSNQGTIAADMQSAGSGYTRIGVDWASVEPTLGVYSSSYIAKIGACATTAHAHGSKVLVVMGPASPSWAWEAGCTGINCPPANDTWYGDALATLATDFPDSNATNGINAFEVWNEANLTSNWNGDEFQYSNLLTAAYTGVKAHSTALVGTSGTAYIAYDWEHSMLAAQWPSQNYDFLAVHPYPHNPAANYNNPAQYLNGSSNLPDTINNLRSLLCTYASRTGCSTPIWFTESGFLGTSITQAQKATGLTDLFSYLKTSGCTACSNVGWVDWFTSWEPVGSPFTTDALIKTDFTFQPAYTAYKNS